jgi:hypothetical protein
VAAALAAALAGHLAPAGNGVDGGGGAITT